MASPYRGRAETRISSGEAAAKRGHKSWSRGLSGADRKPMEGVLKEKGGPRGGGKAPRPTPTPGPRGDVKGLGGNRTMQRADDIIEGRPPKKGDRKS